MSDNAARVALLSTFASHPCFPGLFRAVRDGRRPSVSGVHGSARCLFAAQLAVELRRPAVLAVEEPDSLTVINDLRLLRPEVKSFPFDPGLPSVLEQIKGIGDSAAVVIACHDALTATTSDPTEQAKLLRSVTVNERESLDGLVDWLEDSGYERVDLVTESGEYTTRGGIVDVYPVTEPEPLRIELVADRVFSLRRFDPLSQRSTEAASAVVIRALRQGPGTGCQAIELLPKSILLLADERLSDLGPTVTFAHTADLDFGFARAPGYLGNVKLLRAELETSEHHYFIASSSESRRERLLYLLGDRATSFVANISSGFANEQLKLTLLTEMELYGLTARRLARHRFKGLPVDSLITLQPGDHVVHLDYGIGVFEGTERIRHDEFDKDYLVLRYAEGDRVYVPVENLGLIDRYIGAGEGAVQLDRLGGRSWLLAKARAARASAEYAGELLDSLARRAVTPGTSFPADSSWQAELEAAFPYEETPDQIAALDRVKSDMESHRPMDRLVCGDVGYGKTEIALRAAFKAASGMKQVAILVPTTILCRQHYTTFKRRLDPFPVRVEMLSRFVPLARRQSILGDVADGKVDIVIGTHLLLSVRFRDLGLLILDEEQRFGVRQKEGIRQLKASVDVLTLTATPVPRTLYMALAGLRDISTINTPPPGRRGVETEVAAWDDRLIASYIDREISRGGQVFLVHNRIETLPALKNRLVRLFPSLDVAVAHGQMPPRELEQVYLAFATGEHQLLLSTAIVESGLDLPNVNTVIVDRADRFGLADLHQLRGRVGRSAHQAYALFLVPTQQAITPEARKRLSALLAYSKLGSGFKLALRDLEIRGAGDLLGTRQHGHVARVGLNLYAKMLKETTAKLKGEAVRPEPELSLDVDAYFPDQHVQDSFERVALYRRLLGLDTEEELNEMKDELVDRFGRYPPVVESLFKLALVRIRARDRRLLKVTLKAGKADTACVATLVGERQTLSFEADIDSLLARLGVEAL